MLWSPYFEACKETEEDDDEGAEAEEEGDGDGELALKVKEHSEGGEDATPEQLGQSSQCVDLNSKSKVESKSKNRSKIVSMGKI